MKSSLVKIFIICISFVFYSAVFASERIKVIVTIPVLKDFVESIGKERVEVKSLITGLESEHTYTPKPSDIIAIQEARIFCEVGLGLEIWVKSLVKNVDKEKLLTITTSDGVTVLRDHDYHTQDIEPKESGGNHQSEDQHSHSMGNPHIWLDPENAKMMIMHITEGLIKVDNLNKDEYLKNQADYLIKIDMLTNNILKKMKDLPNKKIITYHPAWPYYARRFGLIIEGNIINQVGTEPSAKSISSLITKMKKENIKVIVSEPQLNKKFPELIAAETGAKIATMTPMNGSIPGTEDYISMMEYNSNQLINALKK